MFTPCSQDSRLVLPLHGNCGGFGSRHLSQPLDDVGCDITDAYELAWVSLSPALTQAGFTPPTPGSPASLSFQMIELAHRSCTPSFSHNEGNSGAFAEWQKGFAR
jgi:hypothetical protein